jgi:hypothetical protein
MVSAGEAEFAFAAADEAPADGSMVPPLTVRCQLERIATVGAFLEPAPLHAFRVRAWALRDTASSLRPACLRPPVLGDRGRKPRGQNQ